jgi:hypothetical protein
MDWGVASRKPGTLSSIPSITKKDKLNIPLMSNIVSRASHNIDMGICTQK